jgi:membrane dipeptidase
MPSESLMTRRFLGQLFAAQIVSQGASATPPYPFVDGLTIANSTPDAAVLSASGLSGVIMDISQPKLVTRPDGINVFPRVYEGTLKNAAAQIRWLRDHPSAALLATRGSDIRRAYQERRTAVFLQTQGCDWLEEDLDRLSVAYELGLRVLQITHNHSNAFGGAGTEREWTGLTAKGQELVRRMNEMNIIPDISHASHLTALDVLKASRRPVTLSHGAARAIVNNARCAPDEVIRGVAAGGGVMGIFMMSFWLTNDPEPTMDALVRQILT